jgi:hypothetical protein
MNNMQWRDIQPTESLTVADMIASVDFPGQFFSVPNDRVGTELKIGEQGRRPVADLFSGCFKTEPLDPVQAARRIGISSPLGVGGSGLPTPNKDEKPTNPKDAIGSGKLPLDLLPESGSVFEALAMLEGGLKYGSYNYRAIGVRASIYYAACRRHLMKWWNGEWDDPNTGVPHLASARACLGIILDAMLMEKLTDDRPPANPKLVELIDASAGDVSRLKDLFKEKRPKHYTISDDQKKD